ncbi:MAG TPA: hypothetical protein VFY27_06760 [Woeseiaceae bacterium]|nr:hypothetical protein [Woeseiaceae bacterium]
MIEALEKVIGSGKGLGVEAYGSHQQSHRVTNRLVVVNDKNCLFLGRRTQATSPVIGINFVRFDRGIVPVWIDNKQVAWQFLERPLGSCTDEEPLQAVSGDCAHNDDGRAEHDVVNLIQRR